MSKSVLILKASPRKKGNAIHTFQSMARYLKADLVGIVYGSASQAGEIQNQPALLERAYKLG